jgi:pyrimidine-specific ribonucleoside hydrolase
VRLFLLGIAVVLTATAATPVVIDTDMGSDDVMAISFLLSHREVPIEAITVVNGLCHVPAGAANARRLVAASGRNEVRVLEGRDTPLQRTADFPDSWRTTSDAPVTNGPSPKARSTERAEAWLAHRMKDTAHPFRILALGPLTNVALTLEASGGKAVEEIVIMGGAFNVPGNLGDGGVFKTNNATAEWNFFVDPKAAAQVFASGVPLRIVPLDATSRVKLDHQFLERFRREAKGPLAEIVKKVLDGEHELIDQGIFYAWDPLAAAALRDPGVATWTPAHVAVRLSGNKAGRSVIENGKTNAKVALDASRERFMTLFTAAFTANVKN